RARHRWRALLPQLGLDTRFLTNKHGPCPMCGGKDRFRFDDKDGTGSYYCNRCGAGVGVILLKKLHDWDHKTACDEIDKIIGLDSKPLPAPAPPDAAKSNDWRARNLQSALADARQPQVRGAYLTPP